MTPTERINKALKTASNYGFIDGAHHKMWVIDQMMRALLEDAYEEYIKTWCGCEDGPDTYTWDVGVAP